MQRADKRKFHYIYKITRTDGRYYIGMHSTDTVDDGYFGSGKLITRSIKKHGIQCHTKQILEYLPTRKDLKIREREIITEELVNDSLCMNLRLGGDGWDSREASKVAIMGNKSANRNHAEITKKIVNTKILRGSGNWFGGKHDGFKGCSPSEDHRRKIGQANAQHQSGSGNSQFGTCWMKKDGSNVKIKKEQKEEYIKNGYLPGRIINKAGFV